MTIVPNLQKDNLLTDYAIGMLKDFYLQNKEKSPQEAYVRASEAWSTFKGKMDVDLATRLYDYVSNKWFMFASPVLSNAPNGITPNIKTGTKYHTGPYLECSLVKNLKKCSLII